MHSRILQISKNPFEPRVHDSDIPDWFYDYADYSIAQPPDQYEEDFRWYRQCTPGTNYIPTRHLMFLNVKQMLEKEQDDYGFYFFIPSASEEYGVEPQDCLMTEYELAVLLDTFEEKDNYQFYCISSLNYHF